MKEEDQSLKQITCPKCNATVGSKLKFCTECGSEIKQTVSSDQTTTCPKCYADIAPGLKFCTECGSEIKQTVSSDQATTCPKCFADVGPGLKFCTECGAEIKRSVSSDQATTCPKCFADVQPGLKFCTECGTSIMIQDISSSSISEKLRQRREAESRSVPPRDETLDTVVESGKGLMKGLGGFLNKTAKSIDQSIENNRQSSASKEILPQNRKEDENLGYLVCDACGGYYQLQQGESANDFETECDCGGKLQYRLEL
ncbi:zinc ribbon domain-containing protein [Methanobacterium formicicum]|uniref:DZANK-type domain-containing protein n=1 Tax=Methanobacterium formicicum TaxID=2162 RepID=A0A090I9V1_METFO|nr:zinc ribbon domain-containing protein [Methanobacterium formicicum]MDH2658977.1 zinc ribbon domain-containing protein [Methanobacterium formicicum]CEA14147.1 hypothetical protein DSM1535_1822 [Methanobacterium formicicum]